MIVNKAMQISSVLFGFLVLLVAENHSLKPQQQVTKNDYKATEVEWSLLINQVAVLRLLNETSRSCSSHEREEQQMRDLRLELNVKTGELNNDLFNMKKELQNMTASSLHEIDTKKEELQNMMAASLHEIYTKKEELENMTAAFLHEISMKKEEAKQELKEAVLNASLQQAAIMTTTPPQQCESGWREYQSSCYKVFKVDVTYVQATANCRAHGAYLASISNWQENSFVKGLIETYTYIGLSDEVQEGVFTWQDGSPFRYSKWDRGEPNNRGNEDCVYMQRNSEWNDEGCNYRTHYVCEKRLH